MAKVANNTLHTLFDCSLSKISTPPDSVVAINAAAISGLPILLFSLTKQTNKYINSITNINLVNFDIFFLFNIQIAVSPIIPKYLSKAIK